MAVIKAGNSKAPLGHVIRYVRQREKTEEKLLTGIGCEPETALYEMTATKALYRKPDGRTYKHFIQSFAPGEGITPETAHEIARMLAERIPAWNGYEILIATHRDREHIHTHFIVNSVSYLDGKKLRWSKEDLRQMKEQSDRLCRQYGLSITEKGKTFEGLVRSEGVAYEKNTYQLLEKAAKGQADSFVQETALAVVECSRRAVSKEQFIRLMEQKGYGVQWSGSRKYLIFEDLERKQAGETKYRIRDKRLETYYRIPFGKEALNDEFRRNLERETGKRIGRGRSDRTDHERAAGQPEGRKPGTETADFPLRRTGGRSRS